MKIDSFPGKTLGLLADLTLKLQHGSRTVGELERFTKGETLFADMFVVPVDRTKKSRLPPYWNDLFRAPAWNNMCKPMLLHPDLDSSGPAFIHLSRLTLCYPPPEERHGLPQAMEIYQFLLHSGKIKQCLNFRDGEEIARHLTRFPAEWGGNRLLLWKSVVKDGHGHYHVPSLCDGQVGSDKEYNWLCWEHFAAYPDFL